LGLPVCMRCEDFIYSFSLDKIAAEEDDKDEATFSKRMLYLCLLIPPISARSDCVCEFKQRVNFLDRSRGGKRVSVRVRDCPCLEHTLFNGNICGCLFLQSLVAFETSGRLASCRL
jgi:hypothetical protein